ncbi:MAG: 50S ribosomal protein L13, partial [Methanosarcinales archaeon]|nr:50S ribosomal protein L13 [Methanosarcinales archaeon]
MSDNTNIINTSVIDAEHMILGRLSSHVAKRLLAGETIDIINAEKTIISGSKVTTLGEYKDSMKRGSKENGPYYPKRPDMILKRTIRGMLPHK